jgi:hypothetical protein
MKEIIFQMILRYFHKHHINTVRYRIEWNSQKQLVNEGVNPNRILNALVDTQRLRRKLTYLEISRKSVNQSLIVRVVSQK